MADRYKVVGNSQSGHGCCFGATVVDTSRPVMVDGKHYDGRFEPICECFEAADADAIAAAMNAAGTPVAWQYYLEAQKIWITVPDANPSPQDFERWRYEGLKVRPLYAGGQPSS